MKAIHLISVLLIFIYSGAFAQDETLLQNFEEEIVDSYEEFYSVSRERVYTHFNKSSYLPGDAIWFSSYVFNPKNQRTSIVTRSLHVELYGPEGELIERKVLPVIAGVASNVFTLGQDRKPGTYTFRAYTHWMQNFGEEYQERRPIRVLGNVESNTPSEVNEFDIQFLPESGTLLTGVDNKLGVKAVSSDGRGAPLTGKVLNGAGVTMQTFELNHLGMGSVIIPAGKKEQLRCEVTLSNGERAYYPLPAAVERGVVAQVNQLRDKVFVNIASNAHTITEPADFYVLLHNEGEVQRVALASLDEKKLSQLMEFDATQLRGGVNCVTVFNEEFKPIAERLFYVENEGVLGELVFGVDTKQDTVTLTLSASRWDLPVESNLSLSVLPGGTVSSNFTSSLHAEVQLAGLRGHIESPSYYFDEDNAQRLLDLDALMLTQGWRRYAWDTILDGSHAELTYENEEGFSIEGSVGKWTKRLSDQAKVLYVLQGTGEMGFVTPDSMGNFRVKELEFIDSTYIYLSVADEKGRGWDRKITASQYSQLEQNARIEVPRGGTRYDNLNELAETDISIYPADINIDEVRFVGKRIAPPESSDLFMDYGANSFTITDETIGEYRSVSDILRQKFRVSNLGTEYAPVYKMNMGASSILLEGDPLIIIDDVPLGANIIYREPGVVVVPDASPIKRINNPAATLAAMPITDIESISVNKTGFGMGSRGFNGVIMVKTRTKPLHAKRNVPILTKVKVNGYASPAEYYEPRYSVLPPDPIYTNYATVHWEPSLITNSEGKATVRFVVPRRLEDIHVRVEGMGNEGTLFLESKTLTIR